MTALKPIENLRVKGVPSTKYPTNDRCAHPDCTEPAGSVHHIFPRSLIGNGSYFVLIEQEDGSGQIVPHAVGLCGSGTTGHHGDLEEHRSWVKLEGNEYVWYDRVPPTDPQDEIPEEWQEWVEIGPLNPQPGSREGKPKRRRLQGAEKARRKNISFWVPNDAENGAEVFDTLLYETKLKMVDLGLKDDPDAITTYIALTGVMASWLQS